MDRPPPNKLTVTPILNDSTASLAAKTGCFRQTFLQSIKSKLTPHKKEKLSIEDPPPSASAYRTVNFGSTPDVHRISHNSTRICSAAAHAAELLRFPSWRERRPISRSLYHLDAVRQRENNPPTAPRSVVAAPAYYAPRVRPSPSSASLGPQSAFATAQQHPTPTYPNVRLRRRESETIEEYVVAPEAQLPRCTKSNSFHSLAIHGSQFGGARDAYLTNPRTSTPKPSSVISSSRSICDYDNRQRTFRGASIDRSGREPVVIQPYDRISTPVSLNSLTSTALTTGQNSSSSAGGPATAVAARPQRFQYDLAIEHPQQHSSSQHSMDARSVASNYDGDGSVYSAASFSTSSGMTGSATPLANATPNSSFYGALPGADGYDGNSNVSQMSNGYPTPSTPTKPFVTGNQHSSGGSNRIAITAPQRREDPNRNGYHQNAVNMHRRSAVGMPSPTSVYQLTPTTTQQPLSRSSSVHGHIGCTTTSTTQEIFIDSPGTPGGERQLTNAIGHALRANGYNGSPSIIVTNNPAQTHQMTQQMLDLAKDIGQKQAEIERLKAELHRHQKSTRHAEKKYSQYEDQLGELHAQRDKHRREAEKLRQRIQRIEEELSETKQRVEETEAAKRASAQNYEQRIEALEKEKAAQRQELARFEELRDGYDKWLQGKAWEEKNLDALNTRLEETEKMLRTREEELGRLREEYQQLKEAMESRKRDDDSSAQQLRSKDQEILQLKAQVEHLQHTLADAHLEESYSAGESACSTPVADEDDLYYDGTPTYEDGALKQKATPNRPQSLLPSKFGADGHPSHRRQRRRPFRTSRSASGTPDSAVAPSISSGFSTATSAATNLQSLREPLKELDSRFGRLRSLFDSTRSAAERVLKGGKPTPKELLGSASESDPAAAELLGQAPITSDVLAQYLDKHIEQVQDLYQQANRLHTALFTINAREAHRRSVDPDACKVQ
ncbi:viral A-type inclusion protein [Aphelenchoides avenae]|nr:viral A-type inclusion protein [Aphelenchus avenae]